MYTPHALPLTIHSYVQYCYDAIPYFLLLQADYGSPILGTQYNNTMVSFQTLPLNQSSDILDEKGGPLIPMYSQEQAQSKGRHNYVVWLSIWTSSVDTYSYLCCVLVNLSAFHFTLLYFNWYCIYGMNEIISASTNWGMYLFVFVWIEACTFLCLCELRCVPFCVCDWVGLLVCWYGILGRYWLFSGALSSCG